MGPASKSFVTKCTVAPCSWSLFLITFSWVFNPGYLGNKDGCKLIIFPRYLLTINSGIIFIYPESIIRSGLLLSRN